MDEIKDLLGEKIKSEFENLSSLKPGSEEKAKAVDNVAKLYKLRIEETKVEAEYNESLHRQNLDLTRRNDELERDETQREEAKKERIFNAVLQIGLTAAGWLAYDIWNRRGLKFEENGTVRSPWTKNIISRMTPKK